MAFDKATALSDTSNKASVSSFRFPGEITGGGYTVFKFGLEFKKKHYYKDLGDRKWVVEEFYLVSNNSAEERRECLV